MNGNLKQVETHSSAMRCSTKVQPSLTSWSAWMVGTLVALVSTLISVDDGGFASKALSADSSTDRVIPPNCWPRFRGPGGLGISQHTNVPIAWDVKSGAGILWKAPVPLEGNNSPVVWNDRVFLSGATEDRREVYCFDADSGKLLWQQKVSGSVHSTAKPPEVMDSTGYAAPTIATDGRHVCAIFANGDVAAFDFDGRQVWARSLGVPDNVYGHAASLTVFGRVLLIQFDQGLAKDKLSRLLALDVATGKTVWQTPRDVSCSWPSPIVTKVNGRAQVVTAGNPWVIAYDPGNGKEIWRANCLRSDVGPSPVIADGIVYVANEFSVLSAIRADGSGDVTQTHVLWTGEDGLPDTASPLATSEFVFVLASYGILTCYDAKKGGMLWDQEFEDATFVSSPSLVGSRLYLFSGEGKAWVVEPTREGCRRLSESNLGEECVTSPAFQDGRLYIRGQQHLFCIGSG